MGIWMAGCVGAWASTAEIEDLAARRHQLANALDHARIDAQRDILEMALGEVHWSLLQHPAWTEDKATHKVKPGDSLSRIARARGVTVELIRLSNRMTRDTLRAGQTLMIPEGVVSLRVDKSANTLTVLRDGRFFKRYRVATGANNSTPVGEFTITDRIEKPTWWRPSDNKPIAFGDPEHELGTHWLAWSAKGFGIHGTNKPESIGTQASLGCVRMLNEDVAELYALVPVGARVTVED